MLKQYIIDSASGIHDDHWNSLGNDGTNGFQTEYAHALYGAFKRRSKSKMDLSLIL